MEHGSEIRSNFLGEKVVITALRGKRPHDHPKIQKPQKKVMPKDCSFCPGNEHLTPPEIDRIERDGKWVIRCFPNKYPAFFEGGKATYGRHEVIVETPDHQKTLSELSLQNFEDYLEMVKRRQMSAFEDKKLKYTIVFKNEGERGGASLEHSHTQVICMGFIPEHIKRIAKKAHEFDKLRKNMPKTTFVQNDGFFAFCPSAPRYRFETWIVPKERQSSLAELEKHDMSQLASILKSVVFAVDSATCFGPYNIVFHSAPHFEKKFPFHIRVVSRISVWAGFEIGTDIVMLSQSPEESAEVLGQELAKGKGRGLFV